ncbi:HAD family hydrolase [Lacunimicrobium album]
MSLPPDDVCIKAVVFDLDGTMFNTEMVFHVAGDDFVRSKGGLMTEALRQQMMGRRAAESMAILKAALSLSESIEQLRHESHTLFMGMLESRLAPMPGLFEILQRIDELGLPRAVATSSHREYLEDILGRYSLLDGFSFTLAAEDVVHGKPHPEIYLAAAERMSLHPSEVLVIEDSGIGTQAGVAAGVHIVSIPHIHSANQNFTGTKHTASSLMDPYLWKLLERAQSGVVSAQS